MPSYKLTYFAVRGLAEPARLLFHLAGVPFEDERLTFGDGSWEKLKDKTPMGQMPVLNVDGFEIPQSAAITRYLARKFGFAGKTPEEEAWVDAVVDQFKDFFGEFRKLIIAQRAGKSVEEIEKLTKEVINPAVSSFFKILNGLLEKSKSGYLIGDSITFADLFIAEDMQSLKNFGFLNATEQPKIAAHLEKVYSHPKLKSYIASRPVTEI
ncbi:glutathione transferase [Caenorhabditis elegans]|uniref:glutathione transferase n=1 Tax=Caenorhabditis elegans TaxID=6239 RepID=Q93695_CAEEL|nr:Glutathione S-Transferase [Caenorhabditis elegans]CAB02288.1 Glutathione S-Transferase [Caenorhabditis elegans]|eukprot:NP_496862.1 Glutathione S-Transferase [Caenorhabditis elegans]